MVRQDRRAPTREAAHQRLSVVVAGGHHDRTPGPLDAVQQTGLQARAVDREIAGHEERHVHGVAAQHRDRQRVGVQVRGEDGANACVRRHRLRAGQREDRAERALDLAAVTPARAPQVVGLREQPVELLAGGEVGRLLDALGLVGQGRPGRPGPGQGDDRGRRQRGGQQQRSSANAEPLPDEQCEQPADHAAGERPQRGPRQRRAHDRVDLTAGAAQQRLISRHDIVDRRAHRRTRLELDADRSREDLRAQPPVGERHVDLQPGAVRGRDRDAAPDAAQVRLCDIGTGQAEPGQAAQNAADERHDHEHGAATTGRVSHDRSL